MPSVMPRLTGGGRGGCRFSFLDTYVEQKRQEWLRAPENCHQLRGDPLFDIRSEPYLSCPCALILIRISPPLFSSETQLPPEHAGEVASLVTLLPPLPPLGVASERSPSACVERVCCGKQNKINVTSTFAAEGPLTYIQILQIGDMITADHLLQRIQLLIFECLI